MKSKLRIVSLSVMVCMLASAALSGCGSSKEVAEKKDTGTTTVTTAEEKIEAKKLTFWQFWNIDKSENSIMPAIKEYDDKNPQVEVETTQLGWGDGFSRIQIAIGAGTAPDVLELGSTWVGAFQKNGALSDITEYIKPEVKDKYVNWDLGELDGKLYAFPWAIGTRALAVNYDLMKKAGLDPKNPPKDWNELYTYAKTITEKTGVPGFGMTCGDPTGDYQAFFSFLYSAGGKMIETKTVDGKDKLVSGVTSDASKKALRFLEKMKPYMLLDTEQNHFLSFESNKVGMFIVGSQFTGHAMENGKELKDWGYEIIPADQDEAALYVLSGECSI